MNWGSACCPSESQFRNSVALLCANQSNQFRLRRVETKLRRDKTARHEITPRWGDKVVELRKKKGAVTPQRQLAVLVQFRGEVDFLEAVAESCPVLCSSLYVS